MNKTTLARRIEARQEIPGPDEVKIHFPEDA